MGNTARKPARSRKAFGRRAVLHEAMVGPLNETNTEARRPVRTASPPAKGIQAVAPALEGYAQNLLLGNVLKRPDLSPRDRSIITVAVLIA